MMRVRFLTNVVRLYLSEIASGLLVPYPPVEDSNCSSSEKQDGRLEIVCTPPLEDCPVEFFCSEDCGPLEKCTALLKSGM